MHRPGTTTGFSSSLKLATKTSANFKPSQTKPTLDYKVFDFKSPQSNLISDKKHYSPSNSAEKKVLLDSRTLSPAEKSKKLTINTEELELKSFSKNDPKQFPQSTKIIQSSHLIPTSTKSKKASGGNDKFFQTKSKEDAKLRESVTAKPTVLQKKGSKAFDPKPETVFPIKESKPKVIEELPPKKFSIPSNPTFSLHNLYNGSHSHRAINSPTEQAQAIYKPQNAPTQRKGSQNPDRELDSNGNFLVDLAGLNPEQMKTISKININNINNINTINNTISERPASPRDTSLQYNDLLTLLNQKNQELNRLNQEKLELKITLESLTKEMTDMKKMKSMLRDKEKQIEILQSNLEGVLSPESLEPRSLASEATHDIAISDVNLKTAEYENIKHLVAKLRELTDPHNAHHHDYHEDDPHGSGKPSHRDKKSPDNNSYSNWEVPRNSNSMATSIYQRNYSSTLDDGTTKKLGNESPYYDALKSTLKSGAASGTSSGKNITAKPSTAKPQTTRVFIKQNEVPKRTEGTPRNLELRNIEPEKIKLSMPKSTTNADLEFLRRKYSHDPKINLERMAHINTSKKSTTVEEDSSSIQKTRKGQYEGIDFGKALGEIKNRIKRLLERHRDNHQKLKEIHEGYVIKLDKLMKEN